jgi:hypothetical protein
MPVQRKAATSAEMVTLKVKRQSRLRRSMRTIRSTAHNHGHCFAPLRSKTFPERFYDF